MPLHYTTPSLAPCPFTYRFQIDLFEKHAETCLALDHFRCLYSHVTRHGLNELAARKSADYIL